MEERHYKEGSTVTQAYTFTYDVYGNLTAIKQGSTALVTYAYNANNGKLISATYANGFVESYVYDALDNIYQVRYNNTVKYSYYYDNSGVLQYVVDVPNGTTEYYECDANGNQIRTVRYKTSDKSVQLINEVVTDDEGQVTGVRYIHADGTVDYYGYTYDEDGKITQLVLPTNDTWKFEEDIYGRLTSESIVKSTGSVLLSKTYSYLAGSGGTNASTHLIGSVAYSDNTTYSYSYDAVGNITEIKKNGTTIRSYVYDELNQLTRENNHELQQYVCYTYDHSGNIQSKTSHAWAGTVLDTDTYAYGNSQWGDLLTNYNGTAISYDASGNPLKWRNVTNLNWQGRKLTGLVIDTMGMQGMNFSYNADGIRTKKSHYNHNDANMYEVSYVLDDTKILSQTYSHAVTKETYTVKFFYDANDAPIAMEYDGNYYYYRTNIQGDIEGIYNSNGTLVVSYSYDAWGNILSTTGTLADTVGEINPFRYRGYYYDTETGWYYLQSRYYDPTVGRFLNADALGYVVLDNSILGINLFSYCKNSCVNISDPIGRGPFLAFGVQFAITVGNFTYGIEALWSTSNGKFYLFLFAGGARSFNSKTLRQTELALKEDIMYLMRSVKKFRISDFKIFKKLSISVSFIAVLGNKRASFPGSYCGWFTGVSFTFWNVVASGAIGVSGKAKIGSLGIGVSTSKASIGYGQTFYAQLTGDKKFENNLAALKSGISSKIAFLKLFACFF